jgi:hypothetical protein
MILDTESRLELDQRPELRDHYDKVLDAFE